MKQGVSRIGQALRTSAQFVPRRSYGVRHKVVDLEDAVELVRSGDTLSVSGFVGQGTPEALLKALGDRYEKTGKPKDLTILFGGGPGDWSHRGLNHVAKEGMVRKSIGAHYGQIPKLAKLALDNKIAAYNLPLGAISRMFRAQSAHQPGYITTVGMGTFCDPLLGGGKISKKAHEEGDVVVRVEILGQPYLLYKSIPVNVAFIRATTADPEGNLTLEHESLYGDSRAIATAVRNSGGIVVAQAKRLAEHGSLRPRDVRIPGVLVDAVYIAPEEDHPMSYNTKFNPAWCAEIKVPLDGLKNLPLDERKIIARRATMELRPNQCVNLGIGMPEGVANVANEELILRYITLTTEPGVIGGVGASGHEFGPASNYEAMVEMNQQFDFYNGGGLNVAFLGMAQVDKHGNVNVSRLSPTHLTGPGGFIDITQCTRKVVFMGTFTAKGFDAKFGGGKMEIVSEGKVSKWVDKVAEVTFSGQQANARGQDVLYITERCVFKLARNGLELIEIAPGISLEKDILPFLAFTPIISDNLKVMDGKIFTDEGMNLKDELFGMSLKERMSFKPETTTMFVDLSGVTITDKNTLLELLNGLDEQFAQFTRANGIQKFHLIANYDGFDIREELEPIYIQAIQKFAEKYYLSAKRYSGEAFLRHKTRETLKMHTAEDTWKALDVDGDGQVSVSELRNVLTSKWGLKPSPEALQIIMDADVDGDGFIQAGQMTLLMDKLAQAIPGFKEHYAELS